jgi:hypothetical protein
VHLKSYVLTAWHVIRYICQEKKKISVTTKANEDYANILDHPSVSRASSLLG